MRPSWADGDEVAEVSTPSPDDVRFVHQLLDVDVDRRLVLIELQSRGATIAQATATLDEALRQRRVST